VIRPIAPGVMGGLDVQNHPLSANDVLRALHRPGRDG
jgi:hypothetical protein